MRQLIPRPRRYSETMIAGLLAATVIVSLFGCSRESKKASEVRSAADTLANGLPRVLLPALSSWITVWRYAAPRFAADSLKRTSSEPFHFDYAWAPAGSRARGIRARAQVDVLSPDSARSLDFDRYLDFDRDPDGRIAPEREPDSSPILADFQRDSVWQVAFCGTLCFYDGAYWIDANRFVLTGATQTGEEGNGPWSSFLEVYELTTGRRTEWLSRPVDGAALARYQAAMDSSLADRLERAGFGKGSNSMAGSRLSSAN
jgi:hypothetical protein